MKRNFPWRNRYRRIPRIKNGHDIPSLTLSKTATSPDVAVSLLTILYTFLFFWRYHPEAKESGCLGIEQLNYEEVLKYVRHVKKRNVSTPTINGYLLSIKRFYEHIKEEGTIDVNPARKIHIRGAVKKIIVNPLSFSELEHLYLEYSFKGEGLEEKQKQVHLRRTVILGLMVFQGLHSGELGKLKPEDVNLQKGHIHIPSGTRSNSRTLALEGKQIVAIHGYLTLLKDKEAGLFNCNIRGMVDQLIQEVKGLNPVITNAGHIRSSVILHWTKIYNKRQVQYMIGHRYISSLEKYQVQDLDSLTDALSKHHPLG